MAGKPITRERLKQAEIELAEVKQQLEHLGGADAARQARQQRTFEPREFNEASRAALIAELLSMADEGATVDEIAAAWNVEAADVVAWGEADVHFGTALRRARTRARAAISAMFRKALTAGRGLPGSLVERLLALYPATDAADGDASEVVHVHSMRAADLGSAAGDG